MVRQRTRKPFSIQRTRRSRTLAELGAKLFDTGQIGSDPTRNGPDKNFRKFFHGAGTHSRAKWAGTCDFCSRALSAAGPHPPPNQVKPTFLRTVSFLGTQLGEAFHLSSGAIVQSHEANSSARDDHSPAPGDAQKTAALHEELIWGPAFRKQYPRSNPQKIKRAGARK